MVQATGWGQTDSFCGLPCSRTARPERSNLDDVVVHENLVELTGGCLAPRHLDQQRHVLGQLRGARGEGSLRPELGRRGGERGQARGREAAPASLSAGSGVGAVERPGVAAKRRVARTQTDDQPDHGRLGGRGCGSRCGGRGGARRRAARWGCVRGRAACLFGWEPGQCLERDHAVEATRALAPQHRAGRADVATCPPSLAPIDRFRGRRCVQFSCCPGQLLELCRGQRALEDRCRRGGCEGAKRAADDNEGNGGSPGWRHRTSVATQT